MLEGQCIAVVIPCYRVTRAIEKVVADVPSCVDRIICVDDCCPDGSGDFIERTIRDPRVKVLRNPVNLGVGGAVIAGYRAARDAGCDIAVKVDGDGQMDPKIVDRFLRPIVAGRADYTKGNRFVDVKHVKDMPAIRLFGNAVLGFMTKLSSGYWDVFDPTNGYTALHLSVLDVLDLDKVANRYFFESDMLFRLNVARAVVQDVPMKAVYGDEESHLKITRIILPFLVGHARNSVKRFFYNHVLRGVDAVTVSAVFGLPALTFGAIFGGYHWWRSVATGEVATLGTVMLAALPVTVGFQLMIAAVQADIESVPRTPIHPMIGGDDAWKREHGRVLD